MVFGCAHACWFEGKKTGTYHETSLWCGNWYYKVLSVGAGPLDILESIITDSPSLLCDRCVRQTWALVTVASSPSPSPSSPWLSSSPKHKHGFPLNQEIDDSCAHWGNTTCKLYVKLVEFSHWESQFFFPLGVPHVMFFQYLQEFQGQLPFCSCATCTYSRIEADLGSTTTRAGVWKVCLYFTFTFLHLFPPAKILAGWNDEVTTWRRNDLVSAIVLKICNGGC